jgi:hypothetical protein
LCDARFSLVGLVNAVSNKHQQSDQGCGHTQDTSGVRPWSSPSRGTHVCADVSPLAFSSSWRFLFLIHIGR